MSMYADNHGIDAGSPTGWRTPMSPEQIRNAILPRTGLARRGYHEQDVDQLLNRVAADVEGWIAENTALRAENDRLKGALREWHSKFNRDSGQAEVVPARRTPDPQAVHVMTRAQQEADSLVAQAQDYARRVTEHARQQYEDVLGAAHQQAQEEADRAVRAYRARAGAQYAAEFEELERRLAWARTFLGAIQGVEAQLKAAREALAFEVEKLGATDRALGGVLPEVTP